MAKIQPVEAKTVKTKVMTLLKEALKKHHFFVTNVTNRVNNHV